MNSKVPTGDTIFADDAAATKRGSSGVAHFAVGKKTSPTTGKGSGVKDAKAKKKIVAKPKPRGTNDAKTRKKLGGVVVPPAKGPGAADAKKRRKTS